MSKYLPFLVAFLLVPFLIGSPINETRAEGVVLCANKGGNLLYRGGEAGNCKKNETEVVVGDGLQGPPGPPGPPADPSTVCPCFDEDILRVGFTFSNPEIDPMNDLNCEIAQNPGSLNSIKLQFSIDDTNRSYVNLVNFLDRPASICEIFPDVRAPDGFLTRDEVMSQNQFDVCEALVLDWLQDLGIDPMVECAL